MTYRNSTPVFLLLVALSAQGADLPGSKDPPDMKRYAGSEIIGYRAPKFDEYLLPLGRPTSVAPPVAYEKSLKVEGLISRYSISRLPAAHRPSCFATINSSSSGWG